MYMNMKQGTCYKCASKLTIPLAQSVVQCKNCNRINLFLCHVIKVEKNVNKYQIQCQQCKEKYAVIHCPKCKGYCGIKNFINGMRYQCLCKYCVIYIICNRCNKMLALPGTKTYQKVQLSCKNCPNQFTYKICGTCRSCIYKNITDKTQIYLCSNQKCPQSSAGNHGMFLPINLDNNDGKQINNRISRFQQEVNNQQTSFKDLCKVCVDKQATMINTKCYHLALCQNCAIDIQRKRDGECPICRTKSTYQKVYKP